MAKKKMAGGDIKIKLADEGGRINWVEEVEEEDPLGARVPPPSGWSTVEVVKKKPAEKVRERGRKEVTLKKETTTPYFVPIGSYLAMKEGKEGGARIEKQLEEKYKAQIMREPGVCRNPDGPKFRAFDVEALGEGALQRLIRGWESGLEIVDVGKGGKTQLCAVMHAMSPSSCYIITPATTNKEEASQDTGSDQIKGVDKEVNYR